MTNLQAKRIRRLWGVSAPLAACLAALAYGEGSK